MEPITTTAMISALVTYLAKKLKDNKSVQDFFNEFTDSTVKWIRPLFLKDENNYEKIIEDLVKKPESQIKQGQVEAAIASHLEDNPEDEDLLKSMYEALQQKANKGESISIVNSSNVNTGPIKAKGNVIIGNNNTTNSPK